MRYLLDANILSDLIRNPHGGVAAQIRKVGADQICTSIVAAAELRYGVSKKQSAQLSQKVDHLFRTIPVLPFEEPADAVYGEMRVKLEKKGRPIGANDMFIAAHALALSYTLVTDNEREFRQVTGLRVENWLRRTK